jgi:hypothetical protein
MPLNTHNARLKPQIEVNNNAFKIILQNTNTILDTPVMKNSFSESEKTVIDLLTSRILLQGEMWKTHWIFHRLWL